MSDIVERLCERINVLRRLATDEGEAQALLLVGAANEIERLRHDLANAKTLAGLVNSNEAHRRFIENDYA